MVGTSHDEQESSNSNKQLMDSFKAMMVESMATMKAELERSINDAEQERFEAMLAKRAHKLCERLTARNRRFEEVNPQWHGRLKEKPSREPWRDKPRQQRKEAYSPQPKEVSKTVLNEQMEAKSTSQPKKATEQVVVHKQSLNPSLDSSGEPKQCKSSKSKEVTCYNSRKKGNFSATCPEKHELNITSLGSKLSSENSSSEVVNQGVETSSSCMMHLVLSKDVDSGHTMEHKDDKTEGSIKEKNPQSVSTTSQACRDNKCEQINYENRVVTKPCPAPATCESDFTLFKAEMLPNILRGTQVSLDGEFIHYWNISTFTRSFKQPVLNVEVSSIIHLILSLSAKEDTGTIDVCKDMPSNSELMTCSLANKRSTEVSNTLLKEQTESKTVEQFPYFKKSLEAKCILSSTQSDYVLEKLTSLEPVYPSSIVCFSQILEEESPKTLQRSLPLINESEQPTSLVPKHVLMPFPFDYPRKHGKEIDLVRTEPNLFVMVSAQDEKRFGLENVKEFCVSKSVFDKIIPTFETFTLEKFFELNGFMFEEFCEFDSSLKVSLCSDAFELFRTKTENALVKTFSELKHVIKNELCDSNLFNVLYKPTVNNHVLEFSISSIMHLFCPMSVEKGTGAMENHKYLRELTIKEKPPDLHQPQSLRGAREELTHFIQIKEEPPDIFVRKKPIAYFRMIFEVGEKVSAKKKIHPTPKTDGPVMINKKIIGDYTYLRGKYKENSLFKVAYSLPPFIADQMDLRTNPFQVGEDDVILPSNMEKELVAELEHGAKDELEPEEALKMPIGLLLQDIHTHKDHLSHGYVFEPHWSHYMLKKDSKWGMVHKHSFSLISGFVPLGFPGEVFNEAYDPYIFIISHYAIQDLSRPIYLHHFVAQDMRRKESDLKSHF